MYKQAVNYVGVKKLHNFKMNALFVVVFFSFLSGCATKHSTYHNKGEIDRYNCSGQDSKNSVGIELGKGGEINFTGPDGEPLKFQRISPESPIPAEILKGGVVDHENFSIMKAVGSCWTIICRNGSCGWALVDDQYCPYHPPH